MLFSALFCTAAMLFISALLLLYSAVVVPFQICMWDYTDPCNTFPTLRFDMFVDTFFMVTCLFVLKILAQACLKRVVLSVFKESCTKHV